MTPERSVPRTVTVEALAAALRTSVPAKAGVIDCQMLAEHIVAALPAAPALVEALRALEREGFGSGCWDPTFCEFPSHQQARAALAAYERGEGQG